MKSSGISLPTQYSHFIWLILGVYGFVLLPPGWTSFKLDSNQQLNDPEYIRNLVGNYSYLALILILVIKFCGKTSVDFMFFMYVGEVFPYK